MRKEPVLRLKRGRERARWHPWIFKGDVADVSDVEPGAVVTVLAAGGHFLARGLYNPGPALCCRILTWRDEPVDAAFYRRRLEAALARRTRDGATPELGRLVWSEADGLPGLVVDRYGPVLVIQCLTLGMARRRRELVTALHALVGDLPVFSADEATPAVLEGFPAERGWVDHEGPGRVVVEEGPVKLGVSFGLGHKTGLYLDQGDNRRRLGALAGGVDVLDAFSYTGAFACHALAAGARRAVCLESSPEAIAAARENFALNGVGARAEIVAGNAFDELRRLEREHARFGLVVLDPPPFARSRQAMDAAVRGYKEVNLRAMRLLAPGGRLATFSCSHHVPEALFEEICREAAADCRVTLRVVTRLTQSSDHPVLLTVPETRYLKGLLLELVG
ncbi:MAG: class I SAM-dependent rRNA methyltransferase [Candidatus Rokubacteria bacterium]|nr:class I SAM-dependent rRNA methyltransferase [Candidatus Rokubacteria bacterium]